MIKVYSPVGGPEALIGERGGGDGDGAGAAGEELGRARMSGVRKAGRVWAGMRIMRIRGICVYYIRGRRCSTLRRRLSRT